MKKHLILSLLIFSSLSFSQTTVLNRLKVNGSTKKNDATRVVVQDSLTKEYHWALKDNFLADKFDLKSYLSTGLIKNGTISINADPTKYNISAGVGIITNFDDPENPTSVIINFPSFTGITPTYLNTGNITYIAINSSSAIVTSASPFSTIQKRDLILLGAVVHSNLTNINVVNNIANPTNAIGNQLHDFIEAVGALNLSGNKYSANGANLTLNKSAGSIFKLGVNFVNDWKKPHELSQSSGTALTFRYRTQNGTESSDVTVINPDVYDLSNVLTTVPNNNYTIQTIALFQTGLTRIQYGQNTYNTMAEAEAAIFTRNYVVENNIATNGIIRGYLIVKKGCTSLQNTSEAKFIESTKFGGTASGGVALTFANIVSALGYTPANDTDVVHKIGNETINGIKTFTNKAAFNDGATVSNSNHSLPVLELTNPFILDRTVKMQFSNPSVIFDVGMMDSSATMFQIKEGSSAYFNVNRTDGKITIGKNSGVPEKTLTIKDNSIGGSTGFRIQAGDTQTDNFISCLYNNNTQGFTVDKNSNILYEKNLNKVIVISGDSFSNDVSQFGSNGDFPTYFLHNQNNHDWQHVVTAVAGRTVATMLANYNTEILPYARNYEHQERMLILYGGVNDIFANRTAVDIYNDLKSMWLNAKNNGFKTVAFRICESTDLTAPQEAERVALNNLISSDKSLYDYLIYADVLFPDASDVTFFADGTHLNYVGAEYLGRNVYNTIYEDKFFTLASNSIISGYKENTYTKHALIGNEDFSSGYVPESYTQKMYVDKNRLQPYTVATLPAGTIGDTAFVTDATAPTYLGALTGGGSVKCPVFYNGTTWVSH